MMSEPEVVALVIEIAMRKGIALERVAFVDDAHEEDGVRHLQRYLSVRRKTFNSPGLPSELRLDISMFAMPREFGEILEEQLGHELEALR